LKKAREFGTEVRKDGIEEGPVQIEKDWKY